MYADEVKAPQAPDEYQAVAQAWYGFNEEAKAAGVLLSNNGLDPIANATTSRVREDKTLVTDGAFAETHEHLGGYYLLYAKTSMKRSTGQRRSPPQSMARLRSVP